MCLESILIFNFLYEINFIIIVSQLNAYNEIIVDMHDTTEPYKHDEEYKSHSGSDHINNCLQPYWIKFYNSLTFQPLQYEGKRGLMTLRTSHLQ